MNYITTRTELTSIANSIRNKRNTESPLVYPQEFISEINKIPTIQPQELPVVEWSLPQNYPNIDLIDMSNMYGAYLIYDLSKCLPEERFISVEGKSSDNTSPWTVARGHLENNVFVAEETFNMASGDVFTQQLDSSNGTVQLWEIKGSNDKFRSIWFKWFATDVKVRNQPCVQRKMRMINCNLTNQMNSDDPDATGTGTYCWTTNLLERDNVWLDGSTFPTHMYRNALKLKSLTFEGFTKYKWTSMLNMFNNCTQLLSLDLSHLNLSNITNMESLCAYCYNLQHISLPNNLSKCTNIKNAFQSCTSLKEIDFSNITFGSSVNIDGTFKNCEHLKKINLSSIQTSNINQTFSNCYVLETLIWNPPQLSISSNFDWYSYVNCYNLSTVDLSFLTRTTGGNFNQFRPNTKVLIPPTFNNTSTITTINLGDYTPSLTYEGLITLFTNLNQCSIENKVVISNNKTLRYMLTAEDIAIATNKGWTVVLS